MNQLDQNSDNRVLLKKILPYSVALIILSLSLYSWSVSTNFLKVRAEERFNFQVTEITQHIIERLKDYEMVLRGGAALFVATGRVSRQEWKDYVKALGIGTHYRGIQGIGVAEFVNRSQIDKHVEKVRAEGFPDYAIRPSGDSEIHAPVIYLEPSNYRNLRALGYDLLSEPIRRTTVEKARDTGKPQITGKVKLVQETEKDVQPGFLMYVPIYRHGDTFSVVRDDQTEPFGNVNSPFRMRDFIEGLFGKSLQDIGLKIYDGDDTSEKSLMYESLDDGKKSSHENEKLFTQKKVIDLYGHQWTLVVTKLASPEVFYETVQPLSILILGCIIAGLAFFFVRSSERTKHKAVVMANDMTVTLRENETALKKSNRALRMISLCNERLIRATDESEFIKDVCRIAITEGEYAYVWVGMAEKNDDKTVRVLAQAGFDDGYLDRVCITYGDDSYCKAPAGMAIRTGVPAIIRDFDDPLYLSWKDEAQKRGYMSSIALPLFVDGEIFGAMNLYSKTPNDFDEDDVKLLSELASDLGFGITTLRTRALAERSVEAVQRSEALLKQVVGNIPNMIFVKDAVDLKFVILNRAGEELFGCPSENVLGKNDYDFFPAEEADFFIKRDQEVLSKGKIIDIPEEEMTSKLLGKRILHTKKIPILGPDGDSQFLLGVSEDITEKKESEEKIARLAAIVDSSDDAIIGKNLDGTITSWNKGAEKIYGYEENEIIGQSISILMPREHNDEFQDLLDQIKRGDPIKHLETIRRTKNGSNIPVSLTVSPIMNRDNVVVGASTIARDISDRLEAERQRQSLQFQLNQAQKLEAIGTLAGGIAHDFNNIIFAITGYTDLAMQDIPKDSSVYSNLKRVMTAAERSGEMVKQILAFSRQGETEAALIDLSPLIKEGLKFLRGPIPTTTEIKYKIGNKLGKIMADPTQMHQVLMNLCINAAHAIDDEPGTITVELTEEDLSGSFTQSTPPLSPGRYLKLSVTDTGSGIPPELIDKLFDPYFTTKEEGKGTGLGLSVVHGIVQTHHGAITVESESGKGATFNIFFPIVENKTSPTDHDSNPELSPTGREHVLVVDDEDQLLDMYERQLKRLGYNVTCFNRPTEALEMFKEAQNKFDLVITDFTMPTMNGLEFAKEIRSIRPGLPIILCSGVSETLPAATIEQAGIRTVVYKPLGKAEMAQTIRQALDNKP